MRYLLALAAVVVLAAGVAGVVLGESDDSPASSSWAACW